MLYRLLRFVLTFPGIRALRDYLLRLQVRLECWTEQGRTIGVRGTVRNMFRRTCEFRWDCDSVWELISDDPVQRGELRQMVEACEAGRTRRVTLFADRPHCTTVTMHSFVFGTPPYALAFKLEGCGARVVMSSREARFFLNHLQAQWPQCCL